MMLYVMHGSPSKDLRLSDEIIRLVSLGVNLKVASRLKVMSKVTRYYRNNFCRRSKTISRGGWLVHLCLPVYRNQGGYPNSYIEFTIMPKITIFFINTQK